VWALVFCLSSLMFLDDSFNLFLFHSLLSKTVEADIDNDGDVTVDAAAVDDTFRSQRQIKRRLRLRRDATRRAEN